MQLLDYFQSYTGVMELLNDKFRNLSVYIWISHHELLSVVALTALLLAACSVGVQTTKVGNFQIAPDFEIETFENVNHQKGEFVSLSGFEGKPVVINFWYPSCPPCRVEMPDLEATFKKYNPKGFRKSHGESERKDAMMLLARIRDGESLSLYYKMIDVDARDFIQNDRFWGPTCNLANALLNQPEMTGDEMHLAILDSFKKYNDDGVEFLGVQSLILDTVEDGQEFIDEFGITFAIGPDIDGAVLIDYGIVNFPSTVFLDKNHEIVRVWAGILTAERLDEIIEPLIQ